MQPTITHPRAEPPLASVGPNNAATRDGDDRPEGHGEFTRVLRQAGIIPTLLQDSDGKILRLQSTEVKSSFALRRALTSYQDPHPGQEFYEVTCPLGLDQCLFPSQLDDDQTYELEMALRLRPQPGQSSVQSPITCSRLSFPLCVRIEDRVLDLALYGYLVKHRSFADLPMSHAGLIADAVTKSDGSAWRPGRPEMIWTQIALVVGSAGWVGTALPEWLFQGPFFASIHFQNCLHPSNLLEYYSHRRSGFHGSVVAEKYSEKYRLCDMQWHEEISHPASLLANYLGRPVYLLSQVLRPLAGLSVMVVVCLTFLSLFRHMRSGPASLRQLPGTTELDAQRERSQSRVRRALRQDLDALAASFSTER